MFENIVIFNVIVSTELPVFIFRLGKEDATESLESTIGIPAL